MFDISHMAAAAFDPPIYSALIRLKPADLSLGAWATRAGLARNVFNDIRRHGNPKSETLQKLLTVVGVSYAEFDAALAPAAGNGAGPLQHPDLPPTRLASADDETVEIIQLDLTLPMGPGATLDEYIEETPVRFDLGYIRAFTRTPPHRLRLAKGVGDSMYPTLVSSDLVWIDSTQTMLNQQDRIWAVSINGAAAIKRLRALKEGRVLVVSDNATVENYEVDADEIMIGGRVIRFARDL